MVVMRGGTPRNTLFERMTKTPHEKNLCFALEKSFCILNNITWTTTAVKTVPNHCAHVY